MVQDQCIDRRLVRSENDQKTFCENGDRLMKLPLDPGTKLYLLILAKPALFSVVVIRSENCSFRYQNNSDPAFCGLNLTIRTGECRLEQCNVLRALPRLPLWNT